MSEHVSTEIAAESATSNRRVARLIAKFGILGFLFFLIKGLLWLIIPAAIAGTVI